MPSSEEMNGKSFHAFDYIEEVFTYNGCLLTVLIMKDTVSVLGFPWWPEVKNLPSSARDTGLIPAQGTEIPHAVGQLGPKVTMLMHGN